MNTEEPYDPFKLAFIFKDVSCTVPANKELAEWLLWAQENENECLRWLYTASQQYNNYGGGANYTWKLWNKRLTKNVNNALKEFNNK